MAKPVALDLKQFKHKSSDDKSTTLVHKDGHSITLAHKALSPENQEQLKALSKMAPKEPRGEKAQDEQARGSQVEAKSAAEGVDKANKLKESKPAAHGTTIQLEEKPEKIGKVKMMADGGDIPEALQPPPEHTPATPLKEITEFDPNAPLPVVPEPNEPYQKAYEDVLQHNKMHNPGQPEDMQQNNALDAALRAKKVDEADQANAKEDQTADAAAANQKIAEQNVKRQALGLPPLPISQIPQDQPMAAAQQRADVGAPQQPAAPDTASFKPQYESGLPGMDKLAGDYYNKGMAAAAGQAKVQEELGKQQEAAYSNKLSQETDLLNHYQQAGDQLNQERQAIKADIANGHIDPDKFWTGYTTADGKQIGGHNKVAAAIGMILAGFNPTNRPNAAIELLNRQMDMGLEAQKQNLNSSHNLLSANLAQYKNLTDATMASRLQMNDAMQDKLGQAAAKATTAGARNAALQAQSQLAQQAIPLAQTLQMRRTLMDLNSNGNKTPGSVGKGVQYLMMLNPEAGKEMQSRYYPPDDVLASKPIPSDVMGKLSEHHKLDMAVRDLHSFVKTHSTMVPGTPEYNVGQQKALALQSAIREGQLGTVYKEGEQPLLDKFINSNPAGMLKTMKTIPQLNELLGGNNRSMNALKQDYGIPIKQMAPMEAPAIKTFNGVKYQQGPTGWHKVK